MIISAWQISEPLHDEFIASQLIDLVLVPLLCFDWRGFRVGYGKGFYDKFITNCRQDCLKIGLSYFAHVDEITDIHEFDEKLDFCVLPNSVIKFT
jgi:5-formyltetrahydrofolate cyclo-ligase